MKQSKQDRLEEAKRIVQAHTRWVNQHRGAWQARRKAFETKFWQWLQGANKDLWEIYSGSDRPNDFGEVSRLKPWLDSYMSSLFHRRIRTIVETPKVFQAPDEEAHPVEALRELFDDWLHRKRVRQKTRQCFEMVLSYEAAAFVLYVEQGDGFVLDRVKVDAMRPWECVWDREAPDWDRQRYVGRLHWMAREEIPQAWDMPDQVTYGARADVVEHGSSRPTNTADMPDQSYVRVLELQYLACHHKVRGASEVPGEYRVYILDQDNDQGGCTEVFVGPLPYYGEDGGPLSTITPVVLGNVPEFPLQGISPIAGVFELVKIENQLLTQYLRKARRLSADQAMYEEGTIDPEALRRLQSGVDGLLVPVDVADGGTLDKKLVWKQQPPPNPHMSEAKRFVNEALLAVQGTAPETRGQPTQYVTATQSEALLGYTENQVGMLRSRMDDSVVELLDCLRFVLAQELERDAKRRTGQALDGAPPAEAGLYVTVNKQAQLVTSKALQSRVTISVNDMAATPMAEQRRQRDWDAASPQLVELINMMELGGTAAAFAKRAIDYLVEVYNLPESFRSQALSQAGELEEPPPPPPGASPPAGPQGSMPMSDLPPPME